MSNKIWQTQINSLNPLVEAYTVGDDYILDQQLLPYDIKATLAQAEMLFKIGVINKNELTQAKKGLKELLRQWQNNAFTIQKHQEDGHTAIEQYLTEKYGEVGKKIHTGRSRNDQSLVMLRLFMKEKLQEIKAATDQLINVLEKKSAANQNIPMPGYTHMQKAMPTNVDTWLGSFTEALKDFLIILEATLKITDQNPLGSASGFGIENIDLDREFTTKKLGFKAVQNNSMYCGLSRGYLENIILQTLSQPMILAGKFANDMLLFTTQEFNFFSLPSTFTTGSSIMPQKRNYDVFEIMRGHVKVFNAYQNEIQNIVSSIGSGYQRDLQLTKKPFVEGINLCLNTIVMLSELIQALQIHKKRLEDAMTDDLFVTHKVYELVKKGLSFRDAYLEIKKKWNKER